MKHLKAFLSLLLGVILAGQICAQSPEFMSYQAVIRNQSNQLVVNQIVGLQISLLSGSMNGNAVYVETHTPTTNDNGLVSVEVGGGTVISGDFSNIDWSASHYFIKTEIDLQGGAIYSISGISQLLSVPYAFFSKTAGSISGEIVEVDPSVPNGVQTGDIQFWNGSEWDVLNAGTDGQILTMCAGTPTWTVGGLCPGQIASIDCNAAIHNGSLFVGVPANNVNIELPYFGGGGSFGAQSSNSTGVSGLVATLNAGPLANGNGSFIFEISGTPSAIGTANFLITIGGQNCTFSRIVTSGTVSSIDCFAASHSGALSNGVPANGISTELSYYGGNGGPYSAQSTSSTGVNGLIATLNPGTLANGNGSLIFEISGTPSAIGTANFLISIAGHSCTLVRTIYPNFNYPNGSIHCSVIPTSVVDVTNPITGEIWMDRNLGASQIATGTADALAYGDLYQWGRFADGHQCRHSQTTNFSSNNDIAGNDNFILGSASPYDWRSPQNDNLWQGINGVNNPCPSGYRLPSEAELNAERLSWTSNNPAGAFASPLKLPVAGARDNFDGSLFWVGTYGLYSTSTVFGTNARHLFFNSNSGAGISYSYRATGRSVRCIKD